MRGIYVHIPFCIKKCLYCDFYSVSDYELTEKYFEALKNEIRYFSEKNGKISVDTVFFGGGTPSSVKAEYILDVIYEIRKNFILSEDAEITLEANPKTFDREKLILYREGGINRLSIGLQSADFRTLRTLGRIHTLQEFEASYFLAREEGFLNINIDMMYGLPCESRETLKKTLDKIKALKPEHISAYALTLSESSPLYALKLNYPDDDSVFENYMTICEELSDYRHYEISNFGKIPCRHNLIYWNRDEYLGFGAAAASFYGGKRYVNKSDIKSYIKDFSEKESIEIINENDALFEYIMLSLRTDGGISLLHIKEKYNFDLYLKNKAFIDLMIKNGYMKMQNDVISLTDKGFFVSNYIISTLEI